MLRREVALNFVKTANRSGARSTFRSSPVSGAIPVTPGAPSPGEDRPPAATGTAPKPSDGYTVHDNSGINPGLVPLPVTADDTSTASLVGRLLKQRIKTERGEARKR